MERGGQEMKMTTGAHTYIHTYINTYTDGERGPRDEDDDRSCIVCLDRERNALLCKFYLCICIHTCIHTYICMHTYVSSYACVCDSREGSVADMHAYMYTHMTCIHTCHRMHVFVVVEQVLCCMHAYIHTFIHT